MFSTITNFKATPLCLLAQFHAYQLRSLNQKKKGLEKQEAQRKGSPPHAKAVLAEFSTEHERQPMSGKKGTNNMTRTDKQVMLFAKENKHLISKTDFYNLPHFGRKWHSFRPFNGTTCSSSIMKQKMFSVWTDHLPTSTSTAGSLLRVQPGFLCLHSQPIWESSHTPALGGDNSTPWGQHSRHIYRPPASASRGVRTTMSKMWTTRKPPPTALISRLNISNIKNTLQPFNTVFIHSSHKKQMKDRASI